MVVLSSSFAAPVEGVLYQSPSTKLLVNAQELGTATLYITENNVVWGGGVAASGGASPTVSLLYPTISLHAIQREPLPALYMVLNYELRLQELQQQGAGDAQPNAQDDDEDDEFDAENHPITQLWFLPQNEADLNSMYSAMSQGQALHPDPADEVEDNPYMDGEESDDGDEEFEDAEESNGTAEEAAARLRQMRLENSNGPHYEDCEDPEAAQE